MGKFANNFKKLVCGTNISTGHQGHADLAFGKQSDQLKLNLTELTYIPWKWSETRRREKLGDW
jgi:hypothetical protein